MNETIKNQINKMTYGKMARIVMYYKIDAKYFRGEAGKHFWIRFNSMGGYTENIKNKVRFPKPVNGTTPFKVRAVKDYEDAFRR